MDIFQKQNQQNLLKDLECEKDSKESSRMQLPFSVMKSLG